MMTVEIVKRMKVKMIDLDKADVVKREVCKVCYVSYKFIRASKVTSTNSETNFKYVNKEQFNSYIGNKSAESNLGKGPRRGGVAHEAGCGQHA